MLHFLGFFPFLVSAQTRVLTLCYDWGDDPTLNLDCGDNHVITLQKYTVGRRQNDTAPENFCSDPFADVTSDCFSVNVDNERRVAAVCSGQSRCNLKLNFFNTVECRERGFEGLKYFEVKYACISRKYTPLFIL